MRGTCRSLGAASRRGAPSHQQLMLMTLRSTDAPPEALRATAEREQRSMQAVAADAIERYTSQRNRRRDEIFAKIMDRDKDLLARPPATALGRDAYPALDGTAAALLVSLVLSHALVDGDERLGWWGVVIFHEPNGRAARIVDVPVPAAFLRTWTTPGGAVTSAADPGRGGHGEHRDRELRVATARDVDAGAQNPADAEPRDEQGWRRQRRRHIHNEGHAQDLPVFFELEGGAVQDRSDDDRLGLLGVVGRTSRLV